MVVSSFGSVCSVCACLCGMRARWGEGEVGNRKGRSWAGQIFACMVCFYKKGGYYYDLAVCVPPKFTCWNPDPQSGSVRMWGLWQVIRSLQGSLKSMRVEPPCVGQVPL